MEKVASCLTLLFMRGDRPREQGHEYWRGQHAQLVARCPGRREYRQHHFTEQGGFWWPASPGLETSPSPDRRVDGVPEVTFNSALSALQGRKINAMIQADEVNVFRRTLLYLTPSTGGRWYRTDPLAPYRAVVLLRRRGTADIAPFLDRLASRLDARPELTELRTMRFSAWRGVLWDTSGVDHTNPEDEQFHAALVLAGASATAVQAAVVDAVHGLDQEEHLAAAHAYDVERTLVYRQEDRPTLPHTSATPAALVTRPSLSPARRPVPAPSAQSAQDRSTTPFPTCTTVDLPGERTEDVIVDADGRLLVGLDGGAIARIDPDSGAAEVLAQTGGRPLGLELLPDGRLLVCDAHRGLLRVDLDDGAVESLVQYVDGVPLRFCSNAAVEADGTIWFTESTSRFDFEHYIGSMLEHRPSGRLMRRDVNGDVEVVLRDLWFANGVTVVPDGSALLFAETAATRLCLLPLSGSPVPTVVADGLPGYPDNLSRFTNGRTWAGIPNPRNRSLEKLGAAPGIVAKAVWALPQKPVPSQTTWAMAFDASGALVADLQTPDAPVKGLTSVVERDGELFGASVEAAQLLRFDAV